MLNIDEYGKAPRLKRPREEEQELISNAILIAKKLKTDTQSQAKSDTPIDGIPGKGSTTSFLPQATSNNPINGESGIGSTTSFLPQATSNNHPINGGSGIGSTTSFLLPPPLPPPSLPLQLPPPPMPPPPPPHPNPCKLFVGRLPYSLQESALRAVFEAVCPTNILDVALLRLPNGRSRGCGFVHVTDLLSATTCTTQLSGRSFIGHPQLRMVVNIAETKVQQRSSPLPVPVLLPLLPPPPFPNPLSSMIPCKLFVGRLPYGYQESEYVHSFPLLQDWIPIFSRLPFLH